MKEMEATKAVIIIAGPQKGTRFRPLSLDVPKPLFLVAGIPIVQHHIEALAKIPSMKEVLLLGFYPANVLDEFVKEMNAAYSGQFSVRYLQEYIPLGTAGGIHHFRDQIRSGNPEAVFIVNGDVCSDFPLQEMLKFHSSAEARNTMTVMTTEATRQQSLNYGCVVKDEDNHTMRHYVEKPATYISSLVNCGVYIIDPTKFFTHLKAVFDEKQGDFYETQDLWKKEVLWLEREILPNLAGSDEVKVFVTNKWWSPVKTAASAIYANRHYLALYKEKCPERLVEVTDSSGKPTILGNVYIHPSAVVHPSAVIGPNVSVSANVKVGIGVRIKESIILDQSIINDHSLILNTIVGQGARVGEWCRIEGTPNDPNPNRPFAKMDNNPLFNDKGQLNPSITIVGSSVFLSNEIILLNSIVLPHKELKQSIKNEIVL